MSWGEGGRGGVTDAKSHVKMVENLNLELG
jgi:hypothetical protein